MSISEAVMRTVKRYSQEPQNATDAEVRAAVRDMERGE